MQKEALRHPAPERLGARAGLVVATRSHERLNEQGVALLTEQRMAVRPRVSVQGVKRRVAVAADERDAGCVEQRTLCIRSAPVRKVAAKKGVPSRSTPLGAGRPPARRPRRSAGSPPPTAWPRPGSKASGGRYTRSAGPASARGPHGEARLQRRPRRTRFASRPACVLPVTALAADSPRGGDPGEGPGR